MVDIFNLIGFVVTAVGSIIVAKALDKWRGVQQEGIFYFFCTFFLFSLGFLWVVIYPIGTAPHDGDLGFFATGAIFALFGANKLFSFTKPR